jgi:hypothetical protein
MSHRWLIASLLTALAVAFLTITTALAFLPRHLELVHLAYVNACAMRSYQYHWQDATRLRQTFRYDFTLSPDSFVLAEVWVIDGPVLSLSQPVPIDCSGPA